MTKKRVILLVNVFLAVALIAAGILTARGVIVLALTGSAVNQAEAAKDAPGPTPPADLLDYQGVTRDNVFGFPSLELRALQSEAALAGTDTPPGELLLIGTVSGALGYAVVLRDSKEELYRLGQLIPGTGHLKSINRDSVIIRGIRGGDLRLPLKDLAVIHEMGDRQGQELSQGKNSFARATGGGSYVVDKSAISEAIENPSSILTHARMLPNFKDGKQQGFVVREVKADGVFHELGIRNGDVLMRINDYEISGPDAALRAFTALRGLDRVELDVQRGGQKLTLTYQIR